MYTNELEAKYTLFDRIDEMLVPETLSKLLAMPVTHVECEAPEVWGNAGSEFIYVDTDAGKFILKTMPMKSDYEMFATDDHLCRSVTLWQYGLLDQVNVHLAHEIIACGHVNDVWSILMKDLSGHFLWEIEEQAPELLPSFLEALAKLHAQFWNDARLRDPRLGLDSPRILFQLSSPSFSREHDDDHWGLLPFWCIGGWEVMEGFLDADVFSHMKALIEDPRPLLDALNRHPYTLLHGDLYQRNLAHRAPNQAVAVDWQLAMCSVMTVDLARIVLRFSLNATKQAQAQTYYRRRLEGHLNQTFEDNEWQAMVELGILTELLWITCYDAYWMDRTDDPDFRHHAEMRLQACNQQVRDGVGRL